MFAHSRSLALAVITWFSFSVVALAGCPRHTRIELKSLLSQDAQVTSQAVGNETQWSQNNAPVASLRVLVGKESDVAKTVKFANRNNYKFFVQNGGNGWGWTKTFDREECGILLDISSLQSVTFNPKKTRALIQGGVGVKKLVTMAAAHNTRIATATCNCLGFLGAALGGGLTRVSGLYGMSVDQLIEANVVLASGDTVRVNAYNHPDLWWALRGAAANFGIVTSALIRAHPIPSGQNIAWEGLLTFPGEKVEAVMQVISNLYLEPHMQVDFNFFTSGAPDYTPLLSVVPFFVGNASAGATAFAPILDLNPINNTMAEVSYHSWNALADSFCDGGGLKQPYAASLARIDPATWVRVFRLFSDFVASNTTAFAGASIIAENYPVHKALEIDNGTSSYPFRDLGHHATFSLAYTDPRLKSSAVAFGTTVRDMLWSTAGTTHNSSYINFAHGDEALPVVYGASLPRLKELKTKYDPKNRFDYWFPLA